MRKLIAINLILLCVLAALPLTLGHAQKPKRNASKTVTNTPSVISQARKAAERITEEELRAYLPFIAADEMEGRDTPSRGLDLTAKFIALNLSLSGLKPGGDNGSYFQPIALRRDRIDPTHSHAEINGQTFSYGDGFLVATLVAGVATGALVYVSHGWVDKARNIDAYKGVDVRDKIMIVSGGGYPPKEVRLGNFKQGDDYDHPYGYAHKHGAKGVIILPHFNTLANWEQKRLEAVEKGAVIVEKLNSQLPAGLYDNMTDGMVGIPTTGSGPPLPVITPSVAMVNALFQGEKTSGTTILNRAVSGDPVPAFDLNPDKKMSFTVGIKSEVASTQNVIAVIEGSDPVLKNEYVAISAHYDHLGMLKIANGDGIYNGADDNGSGTVALLDIAKALAAGPRPKRSLLFIWHTGEEKGLWGARYFTANPTVPINQIIAVLNMDMIGRSRKADDNNPKDKELSGANEIYVIGSKKISAEFGELCERVNRSYLNLNYNYRYDDPADRHGFFFRSDQFAYAEKGIPVVQYFSGLHEDYHQPSDSAEKIDYQKIEKVARTVFMTGWELANLRTRPSVDKRT